MNLIWIDQAYAWSLKILLALIAVLAPIHTLMVVTGVLIFMDLGTGIWRAIKLKEKITSSGLRRTITKLVAYNLAIITGWLLETYFLDPVPVIKIIASVIAITEGKSILENISDITGVDFWSELLKKLQGIKEIPKK